MQLALKRKFKMKIKDENWAMGKPFSSIRNHRDNGRIAYKTGEYHHANGTVIIYQQGYDREDGKTDDKYLMLTFYKNGRRYCRTIRGKVYSDIGIARKAGEFVREHY
jgi:hypothetical protein